MENKVPMTRSFLRNIVNQSSTNKIQKSKSTDKLQTLTNKSPITRQKSINYTDIEHFKIKQDLRIDTIFHLEEENEENLGLFFLFNKKYFCLITKSYDDSQNVFDATLRIYEFNQLNSTENIKVQLLPQYDCLDGYQMISTENYEHVVLLVNESNNDKTIRIISFAEENNLKEYKFKKIKLENPSDKVLMCANEKNIIVLDGQNSLLFKFDYDGNLEQDMGLEVKHDYMCIEEIFCLNMDKIGLFSRSMFKIDVLNVNNGKIMNNQNIDLDVSGLELEKSHVYFDVKSRMFVLDEDNLVKVYSLSNNNAIYLFDFKLHLIKSQYGLSKILFDENFKNVFLLDSLNKTFIFS